MICGRLSVSAIAWRTRLSWSTLAGWSTRIGISRCVAPRAVKILTFGLLNSARLFANTMPLSRSSWPPISALMIAVSSPSVTSTPSSGAEPPHQFGLRS